MRRRRGGRRRCLCEEEGNKEVCALGGRGGGGGGGGGGVCVRRRRRRRMTRSIPCARGAACSSCGSRLPTEPNHQLTLERAHLKRARRPAVLSAPRFDGIPPRGPAMPWRRLAPSHSLACPCVSRRLVAVRWLRPWRCWCWSQLCLQHCSSRYRRYP